MIKLRKYRPISAIKTNQTMINILITYMLAYGELLDKIKNILTNWPTQTLTSLLDWILDTLPYRNI